MTQDEYSCQIIFFSTVKYNHPLPENRTPCKALSITGGCYKKVGGAGGIRTHGKILVLRFFSKEVLSTPQPPLRDVSREEINHILPL